MPCSSRLTSSKSRTGRRFVEGLAQPHRAQLEQLLELSHALTLKSIAADASAAMQSLKAAPSPAEASGSMGTAGRWRLQKEIGSGGMGQVFYATRVAPDDIQVEVHD